MIHEINEASLGVILCLKLDCIDVTTAYEFYVSISVHLDEAISEGFTLAHVKVSLDQESVTS